jgi:undecaprenyl-diphosphatase
MLASLTAADRALGIWLAAHVTGPWLDHVMLWATYSGIRGSIWVAVAIATWIAAPTKRMAAYRLLLSLVLTSLLGEGLIKPLIGRDRPFVNHPEYHDYGVRPESFSFPSGHAASAAAGAVAVTRIWPTPAVAIAAWTLAIVIALSRVALGVHFPADVLAGFAIGYIVARIVCARPPHRDPPAQAAPTRVVQDATPVL